MIILHVILIRIFEYNTGKIAENLISRMLRSQNYGLLLQQTAYGFFLCVWNILNVLLSDNTYVPLIQI